MTQYSSGDKYLRNNINNTQMYFPSKLIQFNSEISPRFTAIMLKKSFHLRLCAKISPTLKVEKNVDFYFGEYFTYLIFVKTLRGCYFPFKIHSIRATCCFFSLYFFFKKKKSNSFFRIFFLFNIIFRTCSNCMLCQTMVFE